MSSNSPPELHQDFDQGHPRVPRQPLSAKDNQLAQPL